MLSPHYREQAISKLTTGCPEAITSSNMKGPTRELGPLQLPTTESDHKHNHYYYYLFIYLFILFYFFFLWGWGRRTRELVPLHPGPHTRSHQSPKRTMCKTESRQQAHWNWVQLSPYNKPTKLRHTTRPARPYHLPNKSVPLPTETSMDLGRRENPDTPVTWPTVHQSLLKPPDNSEKAGIHQTFHATSIKWAAVPNHSNINEDLSVANGKPTLKLPK